MVTRLTPAATMTSTPPASDHDSEYDEWDDVQADAIQLPGAVDELTLLKQRDESRRERKKQKDRDWYDTAVDWTGEKGKALFDATMDFSDKARRKMTVAEVVRQTTKGFSIKFIAVIGLTGVGKSSIIKTLTGSDVHVEHSISAGTSTFAMFPAIIDDQRYILIDTPGFNDENRSDVEIFQEILSWFECMTPYCDLAGILYVHDITAPRFDGAAKLNLEMLKALCGEDFYKNVTIVTTKWGILSESAIRQAVKRQKQFESGPWKGLIAGGTRVLQHRKAVIEEDDDLDDAPPTKEEVREREERYEEARQELCEMMAYYKTSANVKPTLQRELRRKMGMLDTKAGTVLREHLNLPPTPEHVNSDGNSVPSTPSCWTADDRLSLQLQHSPSPRSVVHVVHHHCGTPTPPGSPKKGEKEKDEPPQSREEEKKSGWWANMWRAIRAFFTSGR